ncbi:MAG: hypothetical protein M5U34_41170 [Chloroflexi bacterium]|nr:hypothetical protein [Chloroflexota bacterium]
MVDEGDIAGQRFDGETCFGAAAGGATECGGVGDGVAVVTCLIGGEGEGDGFTVGDGACPGDFVASFCGTNWLLYPTVKGGGDG